MKIKATDTKSRLKIIALNKEIEKNKELASKLGIEIKKEIK